MPAFMGFQVAENTWRSDLAAKHHCKAGPTETYLADSLRIARPLTSARRRTWVSPKCGLKSEG
jgi:hypothetical protein